MVRKKRIKAYKKHFSFALADQDKYLLFLKKYFKETEPCFYSVVAKKQVQGMDCKVWVLTLDDDIENPDHEVIAECVINNENIYLWRDCCWSIAVDKNGKSLYYTSPQHFTTSYLSPHITCIPSESSDLMRFDHCVGRHTIVIFQIGNQIVE